MNRQHTWIQKLSLAFLVFASSAMAQQWESLNEDKTEGVYVSSTGARYVGGHLNGMRHGQGTSTHKGQTYTGQWTNNKPEGFGVLESSSFRYEGEFVAGTYSGQGTMLIKENGATYVGNWRGGKRNGRGKQTFPPLESYEGDFLDDEMQGQGTYRYEDGRVYAGGWIKNQRSGYGEMTKIKDIYVTYRGDWLNGREHGRGQLETSVGKISKGRFENGEYVRGSRDDSDDFSLGKLVVAAVGAGVIANAKIDSGDKARLLGSYVSDVTGNGNGTATAATVQSLKQRQQMTSVLETDARAASGQPRAVAELQSESVAGSRTASPQNSRDPAKGQGRGGSGASARSDVAVEPSNSPAAGVVTAVASAKTERSVQVQSQTGFPRTLSNVWTASGLNKTSADGWCDRETQKIRGVYPTSFSELLSMGTCTCKIDSASPANSTAGLEKEYFCKFDYLVKQNKPEPGAR